MPILEDDSDVRLSVCSASVVDNVLDYSSGGRRFESQLLQSDETLTDISPFDLCAGETGPTSLARGITKNQAGTHGRSIFVSCQFLCWEKSCDFFSCVYSCGRQIPFETGS